MQNKNCVCNDNHGFLVKDNLTLIRYIKEEKGQKIKHYLAFEFENYNFRYEIYYCPACGRKLTNAE